MAVKIDPSLSIVMPIYNEEECIVEVIQTIYSEILSKLPGSELLAIDDGSTDSTAEILRNLAKQFPQVIPFHKENGGHGDALLYGMDKAKGKYIFLTDSDGQTDPKDFWALWSERNGNAFVSGVRDKRNDPFHRLMIARFLRYAIQMFFGIQCRDVNAPFKLMARDFWHKISTFIPRDALTPSLLICIAAKKHHEYIKEINITHLPRQTGECTIRYFKLFRFCTKAFFQLLKFRLSKWNKIERHAAR